MRLQQLSKLFFTALLLLQIFFVAPAYAEFHDSENLTIDRIQLVVQQINLLKNRISQSELEFNRLKEQHDQELSQLSLDKASKNILEKISLDIATAQSNLEAITIEFTDSQQTVSWLEKNIQEIENQLNVMGMFGRKINKRDMLNMQDLRSDLRYQEKLLELEKMRVKYLQHLQTAANNILQLKKDKYIRINALLKSRRLLHIKQQQVKDELSFQEQQNYWMRELNVLYANLAKVNQVDEHDKYIALERDIFYANESANFAYIQSLIARYKDQIRQMKQTVVKSNSISLLNEIRDQVQITSKQITRLDAVLKSRMTVLQKHMVFLAQKKKNHEEIETFIEKLSKLESQYRLSGEALLTLNKNIANLRVTLDHALQVELSSRQGLPSFGVKMLMDLGKEMLLVPALTFQIMKTLSTHLVKSFQATGLAMWILFALAESFILFTFLFLRKILAKTLARPSAWRDQINSKWLSLQWLHRNLIDLLVIGNITGLLFFFEVPLQNFSFIFYLSFVWLIYKSINTISRLCLVETTHDTRGHDMRLYRRLRWIILIGGIISAMTVFFHQLPLVYELRMLCDRLFLLLLMGVSILLLRSWDVVPNLILMHTESQHPYLQKSIRFLGILIPLLMLGNSVIGLFGYVNLILTVAWYEGVFLIVLIGYLILRGLLSDGMEQLSRLLIQHVNNGWLWTEAFLKPVDKVLRMTLFLVAWAVLFLLYGWDKQSPIVERLTRLLQYQLANVLNTTITPLNIIELFVVISVFYWTAKWIREFVYRLLLSRTKDMGIRNSIAILSQYMVVMLGIFICLRVLGVDLRALLAVISLFAFGIGLGLRDLANNFVCGFLILLERPIRVGDIINVNGIEGEVTHIGGRAVTVRTWDHMELVVPNTEIFYKTFTNWTARDNTVRIVTPVKISFHDNPHEVRVIIQTILNEHKEVLKDPVAEVFLKEMNENLIHFELRYFVNIRQVKSRSAVVSAVLMVIWDEFAKHGIKPPYPQHEIFLRNELPERANADITLIEQPQVRN